MKRLLLMLAIVVAALCAATQAAGDPGNGAATPFKATYPSGTTTWTCSGAHVVTKNFIKDSERCLVTGNTAGYQAGTYTGSPSGVFPPYGIVFWQSDFNGAIATSWTETVTDNGDGTFTVDVLAFYAP